MMKDKIYLDQVDYTYGAGTPFEQKALDLVSLGIHEGKITGIIGHTGSGKSTMMQLLNGLSAPDAGKVLLDGYDVNTRPEDVMEEWMKLPEYQHLSKSAAKKAIKKEILARRRMLCFRVGLVMQYPEYQLFEETVYADIAYGPRNMGLSEEEIRERVAEAAAFGGLSKDVMDKSPFDLSGGQKRRVAIAGIMAMRPEVLVLDEPAAGLDPGGRHTIFQGIRDYNRLTGCTVIIVSHSMEDMAQYCDDVVVMAHSKVLMAGSRDEVFARADELEAVGLDIPQITKLMLLLREGGMPVPAGLYTPAAAEDALLEIFAAAKRDREGRRRT